MIVSATVRFKTMRNRPKQRTACIAKRAAVLALPPRNTCFNSTGGSELGLITSLLVRQFRLERQFPLGTLQRDAGR